MAEMTRGALYVIAVEIEDLVQDTNDQDSIRQHHEGNMRVLLGAIRRLDMHGKEVKIVNQACNILRYSISKETPNGSTGQ